MTPSARVHPIRGVAIAAAAALVSASPPAVAQQELLEAALGDLPTEPQALADAIVDDVAEIRGLPFEQEISVRNQSIEEFEQFLTGEMNRSLPPDRAAVFGRVVNKLGLYRGPVIEDATGMVRRLATSQAAAYYNPDESRFYVLFSDAPMAMLAPVYAHELYHGLQDQHWDLEDYLLDGLENGLNDDQMLARQAVVEGEATYVMTLWLMRELTGQVPSGLMLDMAVQMQSQLDVAGLRQLVNSSVVPGTLGDDMDNALAAMDEIPPFMLETMVGAYLKGMGFVHQIVRDGWDEADELYSDPPQSTEQILHPEKWRERDTPVTIEFPAQPSSALDGWTLLDSNVLGEFQARIIFTEFDLRDIGQAAAQGWDGDRYAVYERGDELLLLMATTWDDPGEAQEFAAAYRRLLDVKYPDGEEPAAVEVRGSDVLIVEGGDAEQTQALVGWLAMAKRTD